MKSGHLTSTNQGYLGIQGRDLATQCVQVEGFSQDTKGTSPAQTSGLQAGDIITAVDGRAITDSLDLAGAVLTKTPGTAITLTVTHGSSQLTIKVTLGERPVQYTSNKRADHHRFASASRIDFS